MGNSFEKPLKPQEQTAEVAHSDIPDKLRRLLEEKRKASYGKKIRKGMTIVADGNTYQFSRDPDSDDPGEEVWVMTVVDGKGELLEEKKIQEESDVEFLEKQFRLREES